MKKVPAWAWVVAIGVVLFLPRLGSFGLWEPYEIKFADWARGLTEGHALPPGHQPLAALVAAAGMKIGGTSEWAARLPEALCGILGLLAIYYAASGLFSRRAGLIAAAVVAVTPSYLLQSRSLTSDIATVAAIALAMGGFGRFVLERKPIHGVAGTIGVALASLGAGWLVGVLAPAAALLCAGLLVPDEGEHAWRAVAGFGAALVGAAVVGVLARLALGHLLPKDTTAVVLAQTFWGGPVRHGPSPNTWEEAIRVAGFAFFPASAAVPLALGTFVTTETPVEKPRSFARVYAIAFAAACLAAYMLFSDRVNAELRFPGLGAFAVLAGALFDHLLDDAEPHPMMGIALAVGVMLLARDGFLFPEDFGAAHVRENLRWPAEVKIGDPLLGLSAVIAVALAGATFLRKSTLRTRLYAGALGVAGVMALWNAQVVTGQMSRHVSFKSIFDRYHQLATAGEPLKAFHITGHGVEFYNHGKLDDLATGQQLIDYLKSRSCVYAMVPAEELGGLDQQIRTAQVPYFVVDAESSRYLLLASCLKTGERDQNPLRTYVRTSPPSPPPRRKIHANWENKIELLGIDVPDQVSRVSEGKFTITMHYKVLDKVPAGYKVFIHFDGCSNRFNGDHVPLEGKFPTQFWSPGDYISDPYTVQVPLMTTPACLYQIWAGFFLGDTRLKLSADSPAEPNGSNRVMLGTINVH